MHDAWLQRAVSQAVGLRRLWQDVLPPSLPTWLGISHDQDACGAPALDGLVSAIRREGHKALLGWNNPGRVVHCEAVALRLLLGLLALPNTCTGQGQKL